MSDTDTIEATSLEEALQTLTEADVIHDWADSYGEPGYTSEGPVILGDYWCRCTEHPDDQDTDHPLHGIEHRFPAEYKALEEAGASLEWYDEWYVDSEANKAWRTQPDSYSWQTSLLWIDGDVLTPDDDIRDWIEAVVNSPRHCIPSHVWTDEELAECGFTERECDFQNGWYGQEDDPTLIAEAIQANEPGTDVLFKLSGVGQFHINFCVYTRPADHDENVNGEPLS